MNPMVNGPLPPRRMRRKRRRFPVYYGLIVLVLFLFSGVLYAQAAGVFFEKEKPSQPAETAEASDDPAALPGSADSEEVFGDGEDIVLKQEKPDESGEKPLKEKAKDTRKKAESNKPQREKSGDGKSDARPSGQEKPSVAVADQKSQPQPSASKADTPADALLPFERKVVELVNQERVQRGLAPLKVDVELSKVARVKSEDMRDNRYFSHDSPTYGSPFDMMRKFGIQYRAAGENIAAGYPTPEAAVKGWMNSSGHRANILSSQFTHIGVGYAKGGPYGHYWTQQFISK